LLEHTVAGIARAGAFDIDIGFGFSTIRDRHALRLLTLLDLPLELPESLEGIVVIHPPNTG